MITLDQAMKKLVDNGSVKAEVARMQAKSPENF
jgi:Tfp pilus assembly pilus retraction ATPase PilT